MTENYFNDDQRAYMRYIFSVPRDQRCACGWYLLSQCVRSDCKEAYAADPSAVERRTYPAFDGRQGVNDDRRKTGV